MDVLYHRLSHLIKWPVRAELIATMPSTFRKYFGIKVAVIIDCFEVFINEPSNYMARAYTRSQYKHHNAIRFLIGVISFLSKAWIGQVSDKYLTEHSDFLKHILSGDVALVDRGFDIAYSIGLYCGELIIPAFTKGKAQLSSLDVETTRRIAPVRIHVERVIELLRINTRSCRTFYI